MRRAVLYLAICCFWTNNVSALRPVTLVKRYSRTVWTQADGLPQDYVSRIVQTSDGYLWLATSEGIARFDGYDFTVFTKADGSLPSNAVTALAAGNDGSLWVGTTEGLVHYDGKRFRTFTTKDGLGQNSIAILFVDHAGTLWIVAGGTLTSFDGKAMTGFPAVKDLPFTLQTVSEDRHHVIWIAGFSGLARWDGRKFVSVVDSTTLGGNLITALVPDDQDNLWMAGTLGVVKRSADGKISKFDARQGLPHSFVRSLRMDRNGVLWAGTNSGMAMFTGTGFAPVVGPEGADRDMTVYIYDDREGNLWVGTINGLSRFRDDLFTSYGKSEGLPGDDPVSVHQDRQGRVWIGYHDNGLTLFSPNESRSFSTRDGLPSDEVFSIRETRAGELLLGTRGGLVRVRDGQFRTYHPPDTLGREMVFDSLEDSSGRLWLALPSGLHELQGEKLRPTIPGGTTNLDFIVSLLETRDGTLWAGSFGRGLWRIQDDSKRLFTIADGLSSNQIRYMHQDQDGTLWIPTVGGGLNALREGKFTHVSVKDGLLSDNVASVLDDGESLWLGTTRGICRISKREYWAVTEHKIARLNPVNYGIEDGLRSSQSSPGYPVAAGGTKTSDGRLWFPTSRGLAVYEPGVVRKPELPPAVQLVDATVDGEPVDFSNTPKLAPSSDRIQFRYTAIHLSAPKRVQFSHKLEGLDTDWQSGQRRQISYNSLPQGKYRFVVRAELPGGQVTERAYAFEKLPHFYETVWFRLVGVIVLLAAAWGVYQLRVRQIRCRFTLVLQERARLAREIHDTLAQGFVGISSQLEVVASLWADDESPARRYLDLARRMARHSLTEARRSLNDLRSSVLEGQNLAEALHSGVQIWAASSGVTVDVDVSEVRDEIPAECEQQLLRISQEAVTNALKHASANRISVRLQTKDHKLSLQIADDGQGFEPQDAFSLDGGHFGLVGMSERARRLGGEMRLASHPGEGTKVEVTVPLR